MGTLGRARSATEFVSLFQGSKRTRKRQTSNMRLKWRQELNEVGYLRHSLYHLLFSLLLKIWMPREAASGGDKLWTISCRQEPEKGVISSRGEGRQYVEGREGGTKSQETHDSASQCNHAGDLPHCSSSVGLKVFWKSNKILVCSEAPRA